MWVATTPSLSALTISSTNKNGFLCGSKFSISFVKLIKSTNPSYFLKITTPLCPPNPSEPLAAQLIPPSATTALFGT